MLDIAGRFQIPDEELTWRFVRAGGPGGQNVNKVASKAELRWRLQDNVTLPEDVKARLRTLERRRITNEGELLITSQRTRDQDRNRQDCLDKLTAMVLKAAERPTPRRATRPTASSRRARLRDKKVQATRKQLRRPPSEE